MINISKKGERAEQPPKNSYLIYQVIDAALRHGLRLLPAWAWTERVSLWWGYNYKPAPRVVRLRSKPLIYVNPTDYLQLLIYYLGTFEPHCLPYLRKCANEGGTVVDVGANIGFYTLESSLLVGASGRVISIEAAPPHLKALQENIQRNGLRNVAIIKNAVGDRVGEATLALPQGDNLGMFTLGPVASEEMYRVEVQRIDDVLEQQGVQCVDLIKMDIEGSEFRALIGAATTLARFKPALLLELNEPALQRCGSSTRAVKELLSKAGYFGWIIGRTVVRPIPESQETHVCDECLFIHRERQSLIDKLRLPGFNRA